MAIKKIRLPDGTDVEIDEWLTWPAFSSFEANSASAIKIRLFSYVVGQRLPAAGVPATGRRNATITDTNWLAKSRVNHDEAYIFYSMTYEFFALENSAPYANAPPDLQATSPIFKSTNLALLQRDMIVEMIVGADIQKPQASCPLSYLGQGVGASAAGSGDALLISQGAAVALELQYATGGCVSPRNQRQWQLPIYVHSDRVFHVDMSTPQGPVPGLDQDFLMRVYADGLKRRPIG